MPLPRWMRQLLALGRERSRKVFPRGTAVIGAATVSASMGSASVSSAQKEPAPSRPPYESPTGIVRRYGDRFLLSASDSVVIRVDTVWYPRKSSLRSGRTAPVPLMSSPTAPPSAPAPVYSVPRGGGSGHMSHASHSEAHPL